MNEFKIEYRRRLQQGPTESHENDCSDKKWNLMQGNFLTHKSVFQNICKSERWFYMKCKIHGVIEIMAQPTLISLFTQLHGSCVTLGRWINFSEPVCSSLQYKWCLRQGRLWILTERKWYETRPNSSLHYYFPFLPTSFFSCSISFSSSQYMDCEIFSLLLQLSNHVLHCLPYHSTVMWPWTSYLVSLGGFFVFKMGEMILLISEGSFEDEMS